jgi:hypothetical protein
MREIISGNKNSRIVVADEPGAGGACHEYYIGPRAVVTPDGQPEPPNGEYGHIFFQKGPVFENGVNGCHQEDLLEIVIHRLESFQAGNFACRENALALTKCQEALHWLNHRTAQRVKRGVEGRTIK